jgi:hypothetical protein
VRALTLWRPWPYAIFHAPLHSAKRIENRPWKPWPSIIGQRIVLHAGKAFQKDAVDDILDNVLLEGEPRVLPAEATHEGIIGVCTIAGHVETAEDAALEAGQGQERWFSGPYAWLLTDVRAFKEPIKCKGAQGLWPLEPWMERAVALALKATLPEPAYDTGPF